MVETRVQVYDDELNQKIEKLQNLTEKETGFKPSKSQIGVNAIEQYVEKQLNGERYFK